MLLQTTNADLAGVRQMQWLEWQLAAGAGARCNQVHAADEIHAGQLTKRAAFVETSAYQLGLGPLRHIPPLATVQPLPLITTLPDTVQASARAWIWHTPCTPFCACANFRRGTTTNCYTFPGIRRYNVTPLRQMRSIIFVFLHYNKDNVFWLAIKYFILFVHHIISFSQIYDQRNNNRFSIIIYQEPVQLTIYLKQKDNSI